MYFLEDIAEEEIVMKDIINPLCIRDAKEYVLLGNDKYDPLTEQTVLNMINAIYGHITFPACFICIQEGSAAETIERARRSLLKKVEKENKVEKFEMMRRRVELFLSVTDNPIFQKYRGLLAEIFQALDGWYQN